LKRNPHSDFTLNGSKFLAQTTREKRNHEREGGGIDLRNEGGGREEPNGAGDFLDRIDQRRNKGRNELLDILVRDQGASLGQGIARGLLNVSLCIPDNLREDRNNIRHRASNGNGSGCDHLVENLERTKLHLPFACSPDLMEKGGKNDLNGPRIHHLGEFTGSVDGSRLYSGHFIGESLKENIENALLDEIDLEGLVDGGVFCEGENSISRGLTGRR
jgi:hypothetical protein